MTFGLHTRAAGAQPAIVPFAFLFPGFLIARAPFFTNWKISRFYFLIKCTTPHYGR